MPLHRHFPQYFLLNNVRGVAWKLAFGKVGRSAVDKGGCDCLGEDAIASGGDAIAWACLGYFIRGDAIAWACPEYFIRGDAK